MMEAYQEALEKGLMKARREGDEPIGVVIKEADLYYTAIVTWKDATTGQADISKKAGSNDGLMYAAFRFAGLRITEDRNEALQSTPNA